MNNKFYERYGSLLQRSKEKREEKAAMNICGDKTKDCLKTKAVTAITIGQDSTLRHYQQEAIRQIRTAWESERNVMLQMPTGTGKTRLFVSLINDLCNGRVGNRTLSNDVSGMPHFLIVTHREELVEQVSETLSEHYHLPHGILQGKNTRDTDRTIVVASIQSLTSYWKSGKRLWSGGEDVIENNTYIIIDEAHHSLADSYRQLWQKYPQTYKLGVTATPYRLRKSDFTALYDRLIKSQPIAQFIQDGFLSDYRFYTVDEQQSALQKVNRLTKFNIAGDYQTKDLQEIYAKTEETEFLYQCYAQYAEGKQGIIYAVNRLHAEMISQCFCGHGVNTESIDSKTPIHIRKEMINRFREGCLDVLVNVELFGEGFDCPSIEFAMLARPTRSLAMYLQQVGRALRPTMKADGRATEEPVVILDCVGLHNRFGLPEKERDWDSHFFGNRLAYSEKYNKPLGEKSASSYMPAGWTNNDMRSSMIEIVPQRNAAVHSSKVTESVLEVFANGGRYGIRRGKSTVVVPAVYMAMTKTADGWFYGTDRSNTLAIFDKLGTLVFRMQNSRVVIHDDTTFSIEVNAADGQHFHIGPITKTMYFADRNFKQFAVCDKYYCDTMYLFRHTETNLILDFSEKYKLSTGNGYYRSVISDDKGAVFIDLNNRRFSRTLLNHW